MISGTILAIQVRPAVAGKCGYLACIMAFVVLDAETYEVMTYT